MMHQGSFQTLHTSLWYTTVTVAPVAAGKVEQLYIPLLCLPFPCLSLLPPRLNVLPCFSWMLTMLAVYTGAGKNVSCSKDTYRTDVCMTKLMILKLIDFPTLNCKLFLELVFQCGWSYAITASLQHVWVGHIYISEYQISDWSPPHYCIQALKLVVIIMDLWGICT